jgi:hypothetical protein
VTQDYGLHEGGWDLLRAVSVVDQEDHVFVLVIQLQAVIKLVDAEDSASGHVGADDDVWRKIERGADPLAEVVEAFGELKDQVEPDKALGEHGQAVAID